MAALALDATNAEHIRAAERMLAIKRAQDDLLTYTRLTMPDPEDPGDVNRSKFTVAPHHELLAHALEKVARGYCLRLAISMPPQHGKSELASRRFLAWLSGKFPYKNIMMATYNQTFAEDFGGQVRSIIQSKAHQQVFPNHALRKDSKAKDEMVTTDGGRLVFLGRGGSGTGRPADIFLVDDPLKDDVEANSPTIRESLWQWFTKVAYTRCHAGSAIIIIHTRWHEDDLIGRLCDPEHPDHDPEIARDWTYINIPAIQDNDEIAEALGKKIGDALWPARFPITHLRSAQRLNPRGFSALYQGKPTPDDGDYFQRDNLVENDRDTWPKESEVEFFAASDHAVTKDKQNDPSCLGCVGVDQNQEIWVWPDVLWKHIETDQLVEEIISQMKRHRPRVWWAEADVINKAIGPFLRRRMSEEQVYISIDAKTPSVDKATRARSIQGMTQFKRVHFPKFAPWWPEAKAQLLKFPNGAHDDFVDFLALIGLGLDVQFAAAGPVKPKTVAPRPGTIEWLKQASRIAEQKLRPHWNGF